VGTRVYRSRPRACGTIIPTAQTSAQPARTAKRASEPEKTAVTTAPAVNQAAVKSTDYPRAVPAVESSIAGRAYIFMPPMPLIPLVPMFMLVLMRLDCVSMGGVKVLDWKCMLPL
jgi:hypothetical protein